MSVQVYEDRDSMDSRWLITLILLSILAHVVLFVTIFLISHFMPPPELPAPSTSQPEVTLSLQEPPPAPPQAQPQKRPFMVTDPQANVKPKNTAIESNNDTDLKSQSKTSRNPDSTMPDVVSTNKHATDLHDSPNVTSQQKPQEATPPAPKAEPVKETPPTPPKPQTDQAKPQPKAPDPQPKPVPPDKSKATAPTPPPPQETADGLPVLPMLNAPTIAQQTGTTAAQQAQPAVPPPIMPAEAANVQGRAGMSGAPSPEAMATELGRYKAKVYQAVGSRWYAKVGRQLQLLGVGSVRIQYTIYKDGTVTTKVLDGGSGSMMILLSISQNSITEAAPFDPFNDALRRQIGDSYTDDFTFSVYGN